MEDHINYESLVGERIDPRIEKDIRTRYEHLMRYKYVSSRCKGKTLDLACGIGYGTKIIFDKGIEVIGVDLSNDSLKYASKNYSGPKYLVSMGEKLPFKNDSFDTVVAFEIIKHLVKPEDLLHEIYRILKTEGILFISTPNAGHIGQRIKQSILGKPYQKACPYHVREYYREELIEMIHKAGFKIHSVMGITIPVGRNIWCFLKKIGLHKIPIFLGRYFPEYAANILVRAIKS